MAGLLNAVAIPRGSRFSTLITAANILRTRTKNDDQIDKQRHDVSLCGCWNYFSQFFKVDITQGVNNVSVFVVLFIITCDSRSKTPSYNCLLKATWCSSRKALQTSWITRLQHLDVSEETYTSIITAFDSWEPRVHMNVSGCQT